MEASTLDTLIGETQGVVGVVLATIDGELRAASGGVPDAPAAAAVAGAITAELAKLGNLLGLGELRVASLKAASAARVFARQAGAVVAIELDAKCPLRDLETKLTSVAWAPEEELVVPPAANRIPTAPISERHDRAGRPPPTPPARSRSANPTQPLTTMPRAPGRSSPPPLPGQASGPSPTRPPPLPGTIPTQMTSVGSGPVFMGDLEEFCLPDLLEFLRNSHRTGLLICTNEIGVGTIQLSRGMIIAADSPHALDLREHFLTSSEIDQEQRRMIATLPQECFGDDMIEDVLVARDLVSRDEVERARIARIYSAFREMMGWTTGRFSFDPAVPIATSPTLALSAQSILMSIYQEQDEQGR